MRKWLKGKREKAGYTQQQLANLVSVDITTIGKYENGTRNPSFKVAQRIATVLKFDWTLFYADEEKIS